jgi:hypothetical protein
MKFKKFIRKVEKEYSSDQIEIRNEPMMKPNSAWILLHISRIYRAFVFLENYIKTDEIILCDAGAYPFTFLKVAKLFYPNIKLYSKGLPIV